MIAAMVLIFLILAGFLLLIIGDQLQIRKKLNFSRNVQRAGYLLILTSFVYMVPRPGPGAGLSPFFLLTTITSGILLLWSVFFEFGIERKKHGIPENGLVTTGSYRFCRHPGFWWFALFSLSLGFLQGISAYFFTILLMNSMNLLLIFIQDRYIFPKVFQGYDEYRKQVPFLIPRIQKTMRKP